MNDNTYVIRCLMCPDVGRYQLRLFAAAAGWVITLSGAENHGVCPSCSGNRRCPECGCSRNSGDPVARMNCCDEPTCPLNEIAVN